MSDSLLLRMNSCYACNSVARALLFLMHSCCSCTSFPPPPQGGMDIELVRLGRGCGLWPSGATTAEMALEERFRDGEHKRSYAADKEKIASTAA